MLESLCSVPNSSRMKKMRRVRSSGMARSFLPRRSMNRERIGFNVSFTSLRLTTKMKPGARSKSHSAMEKAPSFRAMNSKALVYCIMVEKTERACLEEASSMNLRPLSPPDVFSSQSWMLLPGAVTPFQMSRLVLRLDCQQ